MQKDKVKNKCVVYTCITGKYDELKEHKYVNSDWDYVCFTDSQLICSDYHTWEIRPIFFKELDDVRNARWHKIHPHIIFPEYEKSVWIDANIDVLNNNLFNDVQLSMNKNSKISIVSHPDRDCIYDELQACIDLQKDDAEIMKKQVDLIKQDGFPKKNGLFDTSIIYREHNNKEIIKIMENWWWWIKKYSRRDQLSLNYVLWKNNYSASILSPETYRKSDSVSFRFDDKHITKEELLLFKRKLQLDIKNKVQEMEKINNELISIKSSKSWKIINFLFKN